MRIWAWLIFLIGLITACVSPRSDTNFNPNLDSAEENGFAFDSDVEIMLTASVPLATGFRFPLGNGDEIAPPGTTFTQGFNNAAGHDGVDVGAACGTPIYAPGNGLVVESILNVDENGDGFGNVIRIQHTLPNGTVRYTQMGHMTERLVQYGDTVLYGQLIGYVGTTGSSTGCHVHLSVLNTNIRGYGYYTPYSVPATHLDPVAFITSNRVTCTPRTYVYDARAAYVAGPNDVRMEIHKDGVLRPFGFQGGGNGQVANDTANNNPTKVWLGGDATGDGFDDLIQVVASDGSPSIYVWVYPATGDGGLYPRQKWLDTSGTPTHAFVGKFDGDNRVDLILGYRNANNTMKWKQCNNNGSAFVSCTDWNASYGNFGDVFLLNDFNGNGRVELLRGGTGGGCPADKRIWQRLPNDAAPQFLKVSGGTTSCWGLPSATYLAGNALVGDGNGSEDDVIQLYPDAGLLSARLGDYVHSSTATNWQLITQPFGTGIPTVNAKHYIAEMNYDGKPDLLAWNGDTLYLMAGNGSSAFTTNPRPTLANGLPQNAGSALVFGYFGRATVNVCE